MAEFKTVATSEYIQIDGLRIAPAEADALKAAVSFAGGMRNFPTLPPSINFEQFVVHFNEDGTLVVNRATGPGEIRFSFDTIDTLILTVAGALETSIDQKRLDPSPRAVGDPGFHDDGDVIEGNY
jgi:hypothetical protein